MGPVVGVPSLWKGKENSVSGVGITTRGGVGRGGRTQETYLVRHLLDSGARRGPRSRAKRGVKGLGHS